MDNKRNNDDNELPFARRDFVLASD